MKKFFKENWGLILVLGLALITAWPLFQPGYFSHHDDLQVMRIFEMRRCFADLQIPCRWVPDMGYGNGFPLFNYYSAFPYYLGAVLSYGLGFMGAAKALFLISIVVGALGMYFLASKLFGNLQGIVAAVLYTFVPYRALDLYVRGALAESLALAVVPLIFFFLYKKSFWGLTISLFILLTSHNIMALFFIPIFLAWSFYWLIRNKFKSLKFVIVSFTLALGLSAFFIIPAFFEKGLVQVDSLTQGALDYRIHFVAFKQFWVRSWGYGASVPGPNDSLSLQIGWPYIFIPVLAILASRKKFLNYFLLGLFLFSIFMAHGKSWFVWENVSLLKYVQFPWRFLAVTAFATSLLAGFIKHKFLLILILLLTVALNFGYFRPEKFYLNLTDQEKLTGELWKQEQKGGILDYLPKTAAEPLEPAPSLPIVREGKAEIESFVSKSNAWEFKAKVEKAATIEVPVFDFPNWQVQVGEGVYPHRQGVIGRITLDLPAGEFLVSGKFRNTHLRTFANTLTAVSLVSLIGLAFYEKGRKIRF
jgi:hypothetical protein